jgi:hypothetical protein
MKRIECLLWDFGDTLCDERFIWNSGPEWMEIYETFDDDGLGAMWSLGEIGTKEFAAALSKRMGRSPESIIDHMTACSSAIHFYEATWEFFQSWHLSQAIVTVNPDLFSEIIAPFYRFDDHRDAIVTSWEEKTDDKRILNRIAIDRLGLDCRNEAALLIDNKRSNIDDWIGIGGVGYHHVGDEAFAVDVERGIDAMAERPSRVQR